MVSDVDALKNGGFLVIPNVVAEADCDLVIGQLSGLKEPGDRAVLQNEWCRTLAVNIQSVVSKILPQLLYLQAVQCTLFQKTEEVNWLVSWHQDRSVPDDSEYPDLNQRKKNNLTLVQPPIEQLEKVLALRLHLDACHSENGPLRIVPGTHRSGLLDKNQQAEARNSEGEMEVHAKKGDVVVMHPLLLHASSKARSTESRRVLHYVFL